MWQFSFFMPCAVEPFRNVSPTFFGRRRHNYSPAVCCALEEAALSAAGTAAAATPWVSCDQGRVVDVKLMRQFRSDNPSRPVEPRVCVRTA